ncbi:hypothetical protein ACTUVK_000531 [Stenotrophomonas rhizophila]|jgi:hypothetical protein
MYGGNGNWFIGGIVLAMIAGAALMGILFWLVPLLWGLIKPWLHMVTG